MSMAIDPIATDSFLKNKKMRKLLFSLIALLILVAVCGRVEEKRSIKIAVNVWPGYAHAFIAQEMGLFKKNGVEVQLVLNKDFSLSSEMFMNRDVDGLFQAFSDIIVLNAQGFKSTVVYVSDYSDSGDVIIGRPEFSSLKDLKGKTVGFEGINSFSHVFVLKALENAGVRETDARFENLPALDVLDALEKGRIDAGHTWEPVKSRAVNKGYKILGKAGDIPGLITDVLAFRPGILKDRSEDIQGIIKSLLEAREFIQTDKKKAVAIMSKAEGMSLSEMEEGLKGVYACGVQNNIRAMAPSEETESLFGSGKIIGEFLLNRGQLTRMPDMAAIVEPKFVKAISGK